MKARPESFTKSPMSRRRFLAAAGGAIPGPSPALANDQIQDVLRLRANEWDGRFNAASGGAADVRSATPTMSPQIVEASRDAIATYSDIVARSGWPTVPPVG